MPKVSKVPKMPKVSEVSKMPEIKWSNQKRTANNEQPGARDACLGSGIDRSLSRISLLAEPSVQGLVLRNFVTVPVIAPTILS